MITCGYSNEIKYRKKFFSILYFSINLRPMRKIFIAILMITGVASVKAQSNASELALMRKVDLADVYLKEVQRVSKKLALIAFDTVPANVPTTKYTSAKFKKVNGKIESYNKTLIDQFMEIIPYADKKEIINSIIYLRGL